MVTSQAGDLARKLFPFASFTSEALRNYRNLAIMHPARAYALNHVFETATTLASIGVGIDPDETQAAIDALPAYLKEHKLLMYPFRDEDDKIQFLDMSYIMPLANIADARKADSLFFDEIFPIGSNPLVSIGSAVATGTDAYTGREIQPDFTERQLGVPVVGDKARRAVGLVEHAARTYLPGLVPPAAGGVNMLEAMRGTINPKSGQPEEPSMFKTTLANIFAFRTYSPTVESQVLNVKHDRYQTNRRISQAWKRWELARTNGDVEQMEIEKVRIIVNRAGLGDTPEIAEEYFAKSAENRVPFSNLPTRKLKEILDRVSEIGELNDRDRKVRAELMQRYQSRRNK
jgi:hypothetical protein